jgi:hypothetical protein
MNSVESNRGGPFCKKGLPGPLPKNSYNLQPLPLKGQGLNPNGGRVGNPFQWPGMPLVVETACNNWEFLKRVQGETFCKKFPPACLQTLPISCNHYYAPTGRAPFRKTSSSAAAIRCFCVRPFSGNLSRTITETKLSRAPRKMYVR